MRNEADRLLGESPVFLQVLEDVSRAATLNKPVLIVGERGTGKEGIASRLHYLSPRWGQEFIKLNCAGIADSLLENELFGHEPGAFTGATKSIKDVLNGPTTAPFFWTNSPIPHWQLRRKFCALLSTGNSSELVAIKPSPAT